MSKELSSFRDRVEEEFAIVHRLGLEIKQPCLKSAMLNVDALVKESIRIVLDSIASELEGIDPSEYSTAERNIIRRIERLRND